MERDIADIVLKNALMDQSTQFLNQLNQSHGLLNSNTFLLPGQLLLNENDFKIPADRKITISKGIQEVHEGSEKLICTEPGLLRFRAPSTYYIESKSKFYSPSVGDQVLRSKPLTIHFSCIYLNVFSMNLDYWNYRR